MQTDDTGCAQGRCTEPELTGLDALALNWKSEIGWIAAQLMWMRAATGEEHSLVFDPYPPLGLCGRNGCMGLGARRDSARLSARSAQARRRRRTLQMPQTAKLVSEDQDKG
ncbi:hypothetical protein CS8_096670 [Cupriavidus sp. 8B]